MVAPSSPSTAETVSQQGEGRGGRGCRAACREAACQGINGTLPKDLER